MALINTYAIWNNKGGVGKSTITYHIATRYAETHPNQQVLVIDMCPQANASMILLGGGTGEGKVLSYGSKSTPQTVVGYLANILSAGSGAPRPQASSFTLMVKDDNPNITDNLYLLCGDGSLELLSSALFYYSNQPVVIPGQLDPWKWVHSIIRTFISDFVADHDQKDVVVFIDTNPAFTIYTEIAIASADRLICPINADDSSRVAANAMIALLHGSNSSNQLYNNWSFATKAKALQMPIPKVHLIVGNRMTQYDGAATAYKAMSDATADLLFTFYAANPGYFTPRASQVRSITDFNNEYSILLRDFNTAGVVTAHLGKLLSQMHNGTYTVHSADVQLRQERINECLSAIDDLIARI